MADVLPSGILRVSVAQLEPVFGDVRGNVERSCAAIARAADRGARLVVLPEACTAGYMFRDRQEASTFAESVPDGPGCSAWLKACREHDVYVVGGIIEAAQGRVFNSAIVVGPEGVVGRFRKVHLWNMEREIFDPGDLGFPVFDLNIGKIGVHLCYDGWFPESYRLAAVGDADLICVPANWVPVPTQPLGFPMMANMLVVTGAHSNQVAIAAASRVGVERGQAFIGSSLIVDHTGTPIAGPAGTDTVDLLVGDVDLEEGRRQRVSNPFNGPLRDRRLDVYDRWFGCAG